ncbi:MAG TPA: response regulator [Rhodobacteraceae bacterium]|nr:response regulator [Paracoccaceae bacterium]
MNILIAESNLNLGSIWARHLERQGAGVEIAPDRDRAILTMADKRPDLIIVSLSLGDAEALSVADYAAYRHPGTKVIFVTRSSFFADGSIFEHCTNACACLPEDTSPDDLAALVEYHLGNAA